jgi:hypothetical protein
VAEALEAMGPAETATIHLPENPQVQMLLACCDPARSLEGDEVFLDFWGEVRGAITELVRAVSKTYAVTTSPFTL